MSNRSSFCGGTEPETMCHGVVLVSVPSVSVVVVQSAFGEGRLQSFSLSPLVNVVASGSTLRSSRKNDAVPGSAGLSEGFTPDSTGSPESYTSAGVPPAPAVIRAQSTPSTVPPPAPPTCSPALGSPSISNVLSGALNAELPMASMSAASANKGTKTARRLRRRPPVGPRTRCVIRFLPPSKRRR